MIAFVAHADVLRRDAGRHWRGDGPVLSLGPQRRRHWKLRATIVVVVLLATWLCFTARLFVWPAQRPVLGARADAILVLNGPGPRWHVALELAHEHAAPVMLVSVGSVRWACPGTSFYDVRVICFRPDPFNTRGEARFAAAEALAHSWHSLIVVSSTPQATRARLRVQRCFKGPIEVVAAQPRPPTWAFDIFYEWGALGKALIWQTSC